MMSSRRWKVITTKLPILYSFRRCPYAIRARMAIWVSGIQVEIREVDLKNKPSAMLEISPKGTVPIVQLPDTTVIEESLDIMLWALKQHDPQNWLPSAANQKLTTHLISNNDQEFKKYLDRYKYPTRFTNEVAFEARARAEEYLNTLEKLLTEHVYLISDHLSLADIAIFPFIRQFSQVDITWFLQTPYKKTQEWLHKLESSELFLNVMKKSEVVK